jgi:hypothetical protein
VARLGLREPVSALVSATALSQAAEPLAWAQQELSAAVLAAVAWLRALAQVLPNLGASLAQHTSQTHCATQTAVKHYSCETS